MVDRSHRVSRLSVHPRYAPRESVFTSAPELYRSDNAVCSPFLRECVLAMEDCCEEAREAQKVVREGTYDLPRITKVLENERIFLLTEEATIRRYKADLTDEIEPQINELISRAEKGLQILLKRESMLQAKVEASMSKRPSSRTAVTINTAGMSKLDIRKIQMLSRQREKLEDDAAALHREIDELELAAMKKR
ncbi:Spc19-domain-containing protein [Fomitopsis serialis]|uniref:Spc19-domain-containing protein n=1 Tax=Fomitopsis serialis TaxID=139415 RepID=UPI002008A3AE|nr:Spc19-domain-containing protein [Neoantrodia serialis]KAH9938090.1 Spc19-domain-containing protein [Neoantrodia serialis]